MGRGTYEKVLTFDGWPYGSKQVIVLSTTLPADDDDRVTITRSIEETVSVLAQGSRRLHRRWKSRPRISSARSGRRDHHQPRSRPVGRWPAAVRRTRRRHPAHPCRHHELRKRYDQQPLPRVPLNRGTSARWSSPGSFDAGRAANVGFASLLPISEIRCESGAVPQLWSSACRGKPGRLMGRRHDQPRGMGHVTRLSSWLRDRPPSRTQEGAPCPPEPALLPS